ncbi:MAG: hypothetical protein ACM3ML_02675 [Micromonosporaceae bacterium]
MRTASSLPRDPADPFCDTVVAHARLALGIGFEHVITFGAGIALAHPSPTTTSPAPNASSRAPTASSPAGAPASP